jgi:hypothetical protein
LCSTEVYLRGNHPAIIEAVESFTHKAAMYSLCPVQGVLVMQLREGQLWMEWRRSGTNKVTLSGYAQRQ